MNSNRNGWDSTKRAKTLYFRRVSFTENRNPYRSNHQRCSMKKGVIRIFVKFTGNSCDRASFLIKLQALGLQFYQKRDSGPRVFL